MFFWTVIGCPKQVSGCLSGRKKSHYGHAPFCTWGKKQPQQDAIEKLREQDVERGAAGTWAVLVRTAACAKNTVKLLACRSIPAIKHKNDRRCLLRRGSLPRI